MKWKLFNQNYVRTIGLLGLMFLYALSTSAQELIQLKQRETQTLRGDMTVVGNGVLGLNGVFQGVNFTSNQEYTGTSNNGRTEFNRFTGGPPSYVRSYIDIDSDPAFDNIFSPAFKANANNFDFGGNLLPGNTGAPADCNENGTFSSSAADLDLNMEACSVVKKAFLYWAGTYSGETRTGVNTPRPGARRGVFNFIPSITPRGRYCNASNPNILEDYTEIKILPPNGSEYYNISIDPASTSNPNGVQLQTEVIVDGLVNSPYNNIIQRNPNISNSGNPGDPIKDEPYVCIADVTSLFVSLQDSGQDVAGYWTVGNVRAATGYRPGQGLASGWTLAVIYENSQPDTTNKSFYFFDGFSVISSGGDPVSFTTPEFQTIPDGPITASIASATLEGDRSLSGDQFLIETQTSKLRNPGGIPLGEDLPPSAINLTETPSTAIGANGNSANFFNSTITNLIPNQNFRMPNSSNTLGYDTDHYELNNQIIENGAVVNTILNNGDPANGEFTDTNATLYLKTDQDSYYHFFTAFAIEVIAPDVIITKKAFRENGTEITDGEIIEFGEVITYKFEAFNQGNDDALNIEFTDVIPGNTFIPNAFDFSDPGIFVNFPSTPNVNIETDNFTDRAGNVYTSQRVSFDIPDLRTVANGAISTLPDSAPNSVSFEFDVEIVDVCSFSRNACINVIENIAFVSFTGFYNTALVDQQGSAFDFDSTCNSFPSGPTIRLANDSEICESQEVDNCIASQTLQAGEGFDQYEWYFVAPPITDQNGNNVIDDEDYSISDGVLIPGANQSTFIETGEGYYIAALTSFVTPCTNSEQSFNVIDSSASATNPLTNATINPTFLEGCSVDGEQIARFILCNDDLTINTSNNYGDGTQLVWSRFIDGSCDRPADDNLCPFIGADCGFTTVKDVVVDSSDLSTREFTVNDTGSYRLEVTLPGGCPIVFYFETIRITSDLDLIVPTEGSCSGDVEVSISNLPLPTSDGLQYTLEYFINDVAVETQTSTDADYGTFMVPRPTGTGTAFTPIVQVRVLATPEVPGVSGGCVFEFEEDVSFLNPLITASFSREPSCFINQSINGAFDDTTGDILVEIESAQAEYTYQLVNADNGDQIDINTNSLNSFTFQDVDATLNYLVRVYTRSEPSRPGADPIDTANCELEFGPISTTPISDYSGIITIEKDPTCTGGVLKVDITSTDSAFDITTVNYQILETETSGTGSSTTIASGIGVVGGALITFDDIANEPLPGEEGVTPDPTSSADLIYFDLNTVSNLVLQLSTTNSCVAAFNFPIDIEPYVPITATASSTNVQCIGDDDGTVTATITTPTDITGRSIFYEISPDPNSVGRQTNAAFEDLPVETYTVNVIEIVDGAEECVITTQEVGVDNAIPLNAPTITPTSLQCADATNPRDVLGSIQIDGPPFDFGGEGTYTYELFKDGSTTAEPVTIDASFQFAGLEAGSYIVTVTDGNDCEISSTPVVINPLAEISLVNDPAPELTCDNDTTVPVQFTATIDNAALSLDSVEGYRVVSSFNPDGSVNTTLVTDDFSNIPGLFNLPAGTHTIEARSANSLCTSNRVTVIIDDLTRIDIASVIPTSPICEAGTDGTISATISNVVTTAGYTYELWTGASTIGNDASIFTTAGRTLIEDGTSTNLNLAVGTTVAAGEYTLRVIDPDTNCPVIIGTTVLDGQAPATVESTEPVYDCTTNEYTFSVNGDGANLGATFEYQLTNGAGTIVEVFSANADFTVTPSATADEDYIVTIRTVINGTPCDGESITVTIPAVPDFTATEGAQEVCINPDDTTTISAVVNVNGTAPFRYRLYSIDGVLETFNTFTAATLNGAGDAFNIEETDLPTAAGTYEYRIVDANVNDEDACGELISITIEEKIVISNIIGENPNCDTLGAIPTTGPNFSFDIAGGDGNFTVAIDGPSGFSDSDTTITNTFTYAFDDSFAEGTYEFTVTDGSSCISETATFDLDYPELITGTAALTGDPVKCIGGTAEIAVTPDGGVGLANLEFTIDGVNLGNTNTTFVQAGTIDFEIRNTLTNCISTGSLVVDEGAPDISILGEILVTPATCDSNAIGAVTVPGSSQIIAQGGRVGTTAYTYVVLDDTGTIVNTITQPSGVAALFTGLDIGDYEVEVTSDAFTPTPGSSPEKCEQETFNFNIPPEPFAQIVDTQFDEIDCIDGVTIYVIIDGGLDPSEFRISTVPGGTGIDASASPTDNIARWLDTDFNTLPAGITIPIFTIGDTTTSPPVNSFITSSDGSVADVSGQIVDQAGVDARFFRITNLPPGQTYTIDVQDLGSGCFGRLDTEEGPSTPSITVESLETTDTGACAVETGTATVTFTSELVPGTTLDIQVINQDVLEGDPAYVLGNTSTFTIPAGSTDTTVHTATVTGLPEVIRARVRVSEQAPGECSDPSDEFSIGTKPEVQLLPENIEATVFCDSNDEIIFTVQAINGNSNAYTYAVVAGDQATAPVAPGAYTFTTGTITVDTTTAPLVVNTTVLAGNPNHLGELAVYVRDMDGCTAGPTIVTIDNVLAPILTIESDAIDECSATATSFDIPITIQNYDATQTYEVEIAGAGTGTITETLTILPGDVDATGTIAETEFTVAQRDTYTVTLTGDRKAGTCESSGSFTIYPAPQVTLDLNEAECDGTINGATATVTNGFEGVTGRVTEYNIYQLPAATVFVEGDPIPAGAIQVNTTGPNLTGVFTETFLTDTQYAVELIDNIPGRTQSCTTTNIDIQRAIILPTFDEPILDLTCPEISVGEITLIPNTTLSDALSVEVFLYSFADEAAANVAIGAGDIRGNFPTAEVLTRTGNTFTDLDERLAYIQVLITGDSKACELAEIIDLTANPFPSPAVFDAANITVTPEVGECNGAQVNSPFIRISIADSTNGVPPYYYRINATDTFVLIPGQDGVTFPVEFDIPVAASNVDQTINVELTDNRGETCSSVARPTIVPAFVPPVGLAVLGATSYSCVTDEEIIVSITNPILGNNYVINLTQFTNVDLVQTPRTDSVPLTGAAVTDYQTTFTVGEPGTYTFEILDDAGTCSDIVMHTVDPIEALDVTGLGSTITCAGETSSISFSVANYIGNYSYTVTSTVAAVTTTITSGTIDNTASPLDTIVIDGDNDVTVASATPTLPVGEYVIDIAAIDAGGIASTNTTFCSDSVTVNVVGPTDPITVTLLNTPLIRCDEEATILVLAEGGVAPYEYVLTEVGGAIAPRTITTSVPALFDMSLALPAGTYNVSVTDREGCGPETPLADIVLVDPTFPSITAALNIAAGCPIDSSIFSITGTATSGTTTAALEYELYVTDDAAGTNPQLLRGDDDDDGVFDEIQPGEFGSPNFYLVRAINDLGCTTDSNVIPVAKTENLRVRTAVNEGISCDTSNTSVFTSGTFASAPYTSEYTQQYEVIPSGGTGPYTIDVVDADISGTATVNVLASVVGTIVNLPGQVGDLGAASVSMPQSTTYFIRVTDDNGCETGTSVVVPPFDPDIKFGVDFTDEALCFGSTSSVSIMPYDPSEPSDVVGGEPGYTFELVIANKDEIATRNAEVLTNANPIRTTPVTEYAQITDNLQAPYDINTIGERVFDNITPLSTLTTLPSGVALPANATYAYKVSSSTCAVAYQPIEFTVRPELTFEDPIVNQISCNGEEDGSIGISITKGLGVGPFTIILIKEEGVTGNEVDDGMITGTPTSLEDGIALTALETDTEPTVFDNLGAGDYTIIISDTGTGCNDIVDVITIEEKDPAIFTNLIQTGGICRGDTSGELTIDITGGTPPYYFDIRPEVEDFSSPWEVFSGARLATELTAQPGTYELIFPLETDILYRLTIIDSGNEIFNMDDFDSCIYEQDFIFETEDLTLFDVEAEPDCGNLDYIIEVNNRTELLDNQVAIVVFEQDANGNDGIGPISFTPVPGESLTFSGVPPGSYNVYLSSLATMCQSPVAMELELLPYDPVQFVTENDLGVEIQPFSSTNEINVYQLQVEGGIVENGTTSYIYEATFTALDSGLSNVLNVESDGTFTIEDTGFYVFRVTDGNGGSTCFDLSSTIGINFIDLDIPNVFNPSSGEAITSTWYPENLTSLFNGGNSPIIDEDGNGEPEIPGLITTSDSEIEGGVITGGTTIGGLTTGGNLTGGSIPETVVGTVETGTGNTVSTVTSGGITVETTTTSTGNTTVVIITGGMVIGGTTSSTGVITGATVTGGTRQPVTGDVTGSGTVFTITSGGTTTGGTTTGGTTIGGTTTTDTGTSSIETIGGTTTGGTSTGGTVTDGTTTVITVPLGGGFPTVEVTTGGTVTGGTTTGGTSTGGTVTGGILTGGSEILQPFEFIDFQNMEVFVFDRYGRLLEEFKGIREKLNGEQGWDGTYQDNEMPTGDYWYLIKLNDSEGREFTGHFTLYRRN